jgi:hypothetical protein
VDFTREPIIETVITPKEGCKIVVRSSKNVGQEEYFVDALEVVSFGNAIFYRSQEKPKAFLVPASDYEILEVREARMVLKNVGLDRSIKIGGGREPKVVKEAPPEKAEAESEGASTSGEEGASTDSRTEKKRDRRRQQRRRRGRDEQPKEEGVPSEAPQGEREPALAEAGVSNGEGRGSSSEGGSTVVSPAMFSALLAPPPTLISETISRYKENVLFKNAFYSKEEGEIAKDEEEQKGITEEEPSEPAVKETPENLVPPAEGEPSPFATFWDDISEPSLPPMPFIERIEGEESPTTEENKE